MLLGERNEMGGCGDIQRWYPVWYAFSVDTIVITVVATVVTAAASMNQSSCNHERAKVPDDGNLRFPMPLRVSF
jgi:hypothetical protein